MAIDKADALRGFLHKNFKAADDANTLWRYESGTFDVSIRPAEAAAKGAAKSVKLKLEEAQKNALKSFDALMEEIDWVASEEERIEKEEEAKRKEEEERAKRETEASKTLREKGEEMQRKAAEVESKHADKVKASEKTDVKRVTDASQEPQTHDVVTEGRTGLAPAKGQHNKNPKE